MLDPRLRHHWTATGHQAVLSRADFDPLEVFVESWPGEERLSDLPIRSALAPGGRVAAQGIVESFVKRAPVARSDPHSWTLSSTITDLSVDANGDVAHAPLDPAGPGTVKWLHHRLMKIHGRLGDPTLENVRASLMGEANRVRDNGPASTRRGWTR